MKRETLEKIRNILENLFVLFISILIMLTAFCTLPVHAAESNSWSLSSNAGFYKWEFIEIFEDDQVIKVINAADYLKKSTDSLRNAVDNDLFSVSPNLDLLYEIEEL